jgi:hypothetical protein
MREMIGSIVEAMSQTDCAFLYLIKLVWPKAQRQQLF